MNLLLGLSTTFSLKTVDIYYTNLMIFIFRAALVLFRIFRLLKVTKLKNNIQSYTTKRSKNLIEHVRAKSKNIVI